jgi:hypothetical protein
MMLRGRNYSKNPYTEELMAKQQKQLNREWIDRVLLDILITAIGFAGGVLYASQFLQRV